MSDLLLSQFENIRDQEVQNALSKMLTSGVVEN